MSVSITRRQSLSVLGAVPLLHLARESDSRTGRLRWWHEAKLGMFVQWALPGVTARPNAARAWAKLARAAGHKYMVMTTKHHDGFCLFDSKLTDYCAPKQACGRDLVREFVDAARGEGRRVGFYYSLMDWHHPDGARCATDEEARRRFVAYTHGQLRELMTNYGKIDVLWYDVPWPLDAAGWESEKMNRMVFALQPDIVVNDRNKLAGDFGADEGGRAWERCVAVNEGADAVVRNLVGCARDGGNCLLSISVRADGSVPDEAVKVLRAVGKRIDAGLV